MSYFDRRDKLVFNKTDDVKKPHGFRGRETRTPQIPEGFTGNCQLPSVDQKLCKTSTPQAG